MKTMVWVCAMVAAMACVSGPVRAADRSVADSLAMSGAAFAAKGNTAQAKEMFYKALANDDTCPDAIFELAKIFDKENSPAAASDFYQRASLLMAQENKPDTVAKRNLADLRVKALNPYSPRLTAIYDDYAQDLDRLVKKVPDTITQEACASRVTDLKMAAVLTPEKMPKFYASAQAQKAAAAPPSGSSSDSPKKPRRSSMYEDETEKVVNNIPPDVERDLKAAGWATVTGTWVKKAAGVYEVTNGKLESPKTNGGIDLWVIKGGSGTVKAAVRNDFNSNDNMYSDYTGYGVAVKPKDCRFYAPAGYTGMTFNGSKAEPSHARTEALLDVNPKNHITITINGGQMDMMLNDKSKIRYNDKTLPNNGPFVIEVKGTAIIENPRCAGQ